MKEYVNKIKDVKIRDMTTLAVDNLPEYFWKIPASSTGKYHPSFSLGEGGLVRHTKFAIDIALDLFNIIEFSELEQSIIISAIILHDGLKRGIIESKYTIEDHADVQADYLNEFWDEFEGKKEIVKCIKRHSGKWSVKEAPKTKLEKFVHTCDYLASRKFYDKYYK